MAMLNPITRNPELKEWHAPAILGSRRPIEYQTENGFAIVRLCDIDESQSMSGTKHCFVVRDPNSYELEITVEISLAAASEACLQNPEHLSPQSSFWINCAERHLADYLWKVEDYPPGAKLIVDRLTIDDFDVARRWKTT